LIKYLIFDLDETLYPKEAGLMKVIVERMNRYMELKLGMERGLVKRLRRNYYERYGTTMRGLQIHHGVDPQDYLTYVHNVPVKDYISPNEALEEALSEIEAEKVIFTNASEEHALRVLRALGIEHHFSRIVDIRALGYACKPEQEAYKRLLEILDAEGGECIIVDDSARNLHPAKELGMITVLVGADSEKGIDFTIEEAADVGEVFSAVKKQVSRGETICKNRRNGVEYTTI
jgi:putative hydrolase of the HAD superfamily